MGNAKLLSQTIMLVSLTIGCQKPMESASTAASSLAGHPEPTQPTAALAAKATSGPAVGSVAAKEEALRLFNQRCTLCHGLQGKGNGPASASLSPRPADYTSPAWQAAISDEAIAKVIVGGGPAVGKSMLMPPNPDLKDKPGVVAAMVSIVRGFKK